MQKFNMTKVYPRLLMAYLAQVISSHALPMSDQRGHHNIWAPPSSVNPTESQGHSGPGVSWLMHLALLRMYITLLVETSYG